MNKRTDSFYDRFSFVYPLVDIFLRPQKKVLFREINDLPEARLLEIGVGNGAHFHLYKRHKVIGIDTSSSMLATASKNRSNRVALMKMNGEALLFMDSEFDYVVLSHVIAVVDEPEQLLAEVFRVLKPGGRLFILNHFTPDNWLKYIDRAFRSFARIFHFRSCFFINEIAAIKNFDLVQEIPLGVASYFKILIYKKC